MDPSGSIFLWLTTHGTRLSTWRRACGATLVLKLGREGKGVCQHGIVAVTELALRGVSLMPCARWWLGSVLASPVRPVATPARP